MLRVRLGLTICLLALAGALGCGSSGGNTVADAGAEGGVDATQPPDSGRDATSTDSGPRPDASDAGDSGAGGETGGMDASDAPADVVPGDSAGDASGDSSSADAADGGDAAMNVDAGGDAGDGAACVPVVGAGGARSTPNGDVQAIVQMGTTIYVGGFFSAVGPVTGGGAPLSDTTSALLTPSPLF